VPFFILLVLLSRPVVLPGPAYALLLTGFAVRVWAAGYIGLAARETSFTTPCRITNGPYKYLKHPLYLGNFLLVAGVLVLFNSPEIYALIIMVLFIVMYGIIILSEDDYVKQLPVKKVEFQINNCNGEISTMVILIVIVLISLLVPKSILFTF